MSLVNTRRDAEFSVGICRPPNVLFADDTWDLGAQLGVLRQLITSPKPNRQQPVSDRDRTPDWQLPIFDGRFLGFVSGDLQASTCGVGQ